MESSYGLLSLFVVGWLVVRMRRQAERWGAELFQEDVEFIDVINTPFTVKSSERKVIVFILRVCL